MATEAAIFATATELWILNFLWSCKRPVDVRAASEYYYGSATTGQSETIRDLLKRLSEKGFAQHSAGKPQLWSATITREDYVARLLMSEVARVLCSVAGRDGNQVVSLIREWPEFAALGERVRKECAQSDVHTK